MELVLLMGLQASGKSTFWRERYADTHVRINLDMLRTRHRERRLFATCLEVGQPVVVDNTNVSAADREPYITQAKARGFRVVGYYFRSALAECLERNRLRPEHQRIPDRGVRGAAGRLELPSSSEGFESLWYVRIDPQVGFIVAPWQAEVAP
jgi:predicted kinase